MNPPDKAEKKIRFGCGFIFGVFFAFLSLFIKFWPMNGNILFVLAIGVGVLMGFGAKKYGDDFWESIIKNSWWW